MGEEAGLNNSGKVKYSKIEDETEEFTFGDFVKAFLFGALDGLLMSFAIVAGASGGQLETHVILIIGFSNLISNSVSMGAGEFLSSKAQNEFLDQARKREEWHIQNNRSAGVDDVAEIYQERGVSESDARTIAKSISKYDDLFVETLISDELGVPNCQKVDESESLKEGLLMLFSFALFGSFPLWPFVIIPNNFTSLEPSIFLISSVVTAFGIFVVGACKSIYSARGWFFSGLETIMVGGSCSLLAYEAGYLLSEYLV
eukprot:CAMPEP_0171460996 /NCGR_PEP_ID=MMETSP0945-20130129/5634_1 /TAXON_ID=109269 /ORGANISM="Vaucheria litorea, Strain CCMP2940" /LENGTH=257 /DNA_ID=CAMNT_0011987281 /DNA_START=80 /DNA_END=853 /DNA_ORIENTATION=+